MTVSLIPQKKATLKKFVNQLLTIRSPTIRFLAKVLGTLVASFPGSKMGHYIIEALILIKPMHLLHRQGTVMPMCNCLRIASRSLHGGNERWMLCLIGFPHLPLHMQCLVMHPTLHGVSTSLHPQGVHGMHTKLHFISM